MKNLTRNVVILTLFFIIIFVSVYSLSNTPNTLMKHYNFKLIFEKYISNQHADDNMALFDNESQKFIFHGPSPFSPSADQSYHVPPILYVDDSKNIYVLIPGRVEVFDTLGNSLLKFYIPEDSLSLDYYSWDEKGLYLFFKNRYSGVEYETFEINILNGKIKELNQNDLQLISPALLPPSSKKEMVQTQTYIRSISDKEGTYYGIGWSTGNYSLLHGDNARYIDPKEIVVLKFDRSYNNLYLGPLPTEVISAHSDVYDKYLYDNINIENLFDEKVVCIGRRNSYVDKKGNIFLIGLKSYDVNKIYNNESKSNYSIEVKKPVLFLAKLENK